MKYELISLQTKMGEYTWKELLDYFEPDKNELPEAYKAWADISDIDDLRDMLKEDGVYTINPVYEFVYELRKGNVEIDSKDRFDIEAGCTIDVDSDPELIKTFFDKVSAKEELNKYMSKLISRPSNSLYLFTEYYIEEVKYDEYGDFIEGGDIIDISLVNIPVIDRESAEAIKHFDNLKEAEIFANENENYYVGI